MFMSKELKARLQALCLSWLVRIFHTGLTVAVVLLLFLKTSDLTVALASEQYVIVCCYLACVFITLSLYYTASLLNPGYVSDNTTPNIKKPVQVYPRPTGIINNNNNNNNSAGIHQAFISTENKVPRIQLGAHKPRVCSACHVQQPLRAKHCDDCGRCVRRFDHHCPWLGTCVGELNHKFFWLFLISQLILICWTIVLVWNGFTNPRLWTEWFRDNTLHLLSIIVLVGGFFIVTLLLICHTFLISSNQTTWEYMARQRITYLRDLDEGVNPFDRGLIGNCLKFLCYCRIQTWEKYCDTHTHHIKPSPDIRHIVRWV